MKCIYLGKENVQSIDDIYDTFADELNLPEYFGRNLDALNDCLGELSSPLLIAIADRDFLSELIGPKFSSLEFMLSEIESVTVRYLA